MTSLHVIYGLALRPNPKSGLRLSIKPCAIRIPDTDCGILVLLTHLHERLLTTLQRCKAEVESRTQGSRPRPRPRTQKKSEAKAKAKDSLSEDRHSRGQGQECSRPRPRTKDTKRKCSPKKKKKGLHKNFSGDLQKKKKKRSSQKFFKRSPLKNVFQKIFQPLHKILTFQKIVLSSSRGQANFRGLEVSRPRPRT